MKKITIGVFMLFSAPAWSQDGIIDASFGTNGYVLVANNEGATFGESVQPDGKIIYTQGAKFKRLNANGAPDTTFGVNGVVNIAQESYYIENYWTLNNQIILLTKDYFNDIYRMGRYNFDNTVDTGFGNGTGFMVLNIGNNIKGRVRMKLSNDGKIYMGGNSVTSYGTYNNYYVKRINLNGTEDTSYNYNASSGSGINISSTSIGYYTDEIIGDIDVSSTGQVIVSGLSTYREGHAFYYRRATFAIVPNSSTVPVTKSHSYTAYYSSAKSDVALDKINNIYLLGGQNMVNVIGKYTSAGANFISFGTNGYLTLPDLVIESNKKADFTKILIQPDGKILLGGTVMPETGTVNNPYLIMARYNQNGTIDSTFGTNGYVLFDIPHPNSGDSLNTFTHFFASPDFSSLYMCGKNAQNAAVIKYNNTSTIMAVAEAEENSLDLKVYPNPVQDVLNISLDQKILSMTVYNMAGQQVLTKVINDNKGTADVSALVPGTYMVKVNTANETVKTVKIIKQ